MATVAHAPRGRSLSVQAVLRAYAFWPKGALRMWQRNATIGRKSVVVTLGPRFLEAIAYLAIMGLGLGTYLTTVRGIGYVDFIAPGVAASTVMFGAVIETTYNSFVRIHIRRVFEAVVTTPLSVRDVVVGEYLWASTRAVAYGITFLIVMATFGLVASPAALLVPPLFVLGALTFSAVGMSYTALVTNIEHFNIFYTAFLTPMFLFGGVFFPFSDLPAWAQVVGWCLPLSHLVEATRDLVLGDLSWTIAAHAGALAGLLAVLFPFPPSRLSKTLLR